MANKTNHPKKEAAAAASANVSARLTQGEHAALEQLLKRRAAEMEAQSLPGDDSFAGWLRWVIRKEAKGAGIVVESPHTAEPTKAKRRAK